MRLSQLQNRLQFRFRRQSSSSKTLIYKGYESASHVLDPLGLHQVLGQADLPFSFASSVPNTFPIYFRYNVDFRGSNNLGACFATTWLWKGSDIHSNWLAETDLKKAE